jgi:lysophospholipase L1-like esterase
MHRTLQTAGFSTHPPAVRFDRLNKLAGILTGALFCAALHATPNAAPPSSASEARVAFRAGDVVAFVGGADVAAAQHTGHLEALLAAQFPELRLRFRNFGWEGDTVFGQPRDYGFPSLDTHLERAGASVIVVQFGRIEALRGPGALPSFAEAYGKLLDQLARRTSRLVLVTPPPFERGGGALPDLSARNHDLAEYAAAIRQHARQRHLPLVDLFAELGGAGHRGQVFTDNGLQLTPRGQALVARAFARQLGFGKMAELAGDPDANGVWPHATLEQVRRETVSKNWLWFNYWRPQNWAFLGGDRTNQPSSRDHRDPKIRWFPDEMEQFLPRIEQAESRVAEAARQVAP